MPIVITCQSCQTRMKVPDQAAGKSVKCPKCSATIAVAATGNDQPAAKPPASAPPPATSKPTSAPAASAPAADTGAAAAPPKKSKKGLMIGLGVAAFLLLSCCCLGSGGTGVYFVYFNVEKNEKVTKANYDAVKDGMTLQDLEAKLGTSKATTVEDVKAGYKSKQGPDLDKIVKTHEAAISKDADYRWRNGDDFIFVIFDKSAKDNGKAVTLYWVGNATTPPVLVEKPSVPK